MAQTRFRVGGAYTRLQWTSPGSTTPQTLAYVDIIRETAPKYVAAPQPIQPLDQEYPIEIALPGALEAGMLEVQFREQWNSEVWNAFYTTYNDPITSTKNIYIADLLGIFKAQLQAGNSGISLTKLIIDPTTGQAVRTIQYHDPVIVNIAVDETVQINSMTFPKSVQFMYLYRTETVNPLANGSQLTTKPTYSDSSYGPTAAGK